MAALWNFSCQQRLPSGILFPVLYTDFVTSHRRPLTNDSACHKPWEIDPPILQLKEPHAQLGMIGRVGESVRDLWRLRMMLSA